MGGNVLVGEWKRMMQSVSKGAYGRDNIFPNEGDLVKIHVQLTNLLHVFCLSSEKK